MQEQLFGVFKMPNSDFKFTRVDRFLDDINREDCFDTQDMDGVSPNFKFILVSECSQNIEKCLDEDGTLITPYDSLTDTGVNIIDTDGVDDGLCSILWSEGVNGERTMSIADSTVTYDFGENTEHIRGIFLVSLANGTGYVIAYSIFDKTLELDGTSIFPVNGMIWGIRYGN